MNSEKNIIQSLTWRYACKKFDENRKLNKDQIDVLSKAFNLTATSFGLQPLKMLIVKSDALKAKLRPHAYFQPQITTCSHLLVICIDTAFNEDSIDAYFDLEKDIRGTSEEIVGKFRNQLKTIYKNKDRQQIDTSAIYQAYISIGTLMTVCAEQRIDSCPMEGFNPVKFDEILELEKKDLRSVLLLPVGYRADDDIMSAMKKVRKPLDQVIIEID
ncbi:NAD(P)H-dependent oxidoreductase [Lutimonas sp.]|jgi:nitroreductase/dihydropteridine reductase|uniref:NAD(P)H-dependent oxidoreductase n=1 Tax=Lutimonas sp. TaxID=1872403 RepID=UPI003C706EE3